MNPGKLTLIRSLVAAAAVLGLVARTAAQAQSVNINSQLMITDLRVVEDPIRTNPRNGARAAWTFKSLMTAMAGPNDPSEFVMRWLKTWETDQVIHGSVARARPDIRRKVIAPWLQASGGKSLNLDIAPFKLLAIVNRMDLRAHDSDAVATAGEGRFVFGLLGPDGKPLAPLLGAGVNPGGFVVIFEYELVANNMAQLAEWTLLWANLGRFQIGTPQYNTALEAVTRRFTDRGRAPRKPNGSAINQIRSNELSLAEPWELREFRIQNGWMAPHGMAQTPDFIALNGTPALVDLINDNEEALLDGTFVLPAEMQAASSLAGAFQRTHFPDFESRTFTANALSATLFDIPWSGAGIANNDARQSFALNTCGGCHRAETAINFLHVGFPVGHSLPRSLGKPAALSGFMSGKTIQDPVDPSTTRTFNDLGRRKLDLEALIRSFGPANGSTGPRTRHVPNFVH